MAPYPTELRVRVVAAVEDGGLSIPEAARIFQVGLTFIKKMLRLHRAGKEKGVAVASSSLRQLPLLRRSVARRRGLKAPNCAGDSEGNAPDNQPTLLNFAGYAADSAV